MSINPTAAPFTTVTGRIAAVDAYPRNKPTRFTTLVRLPAEDEYTTPETVELTSTHEIGKVGEIVESVKCRVGGRYRSYFAKAGQPDETLVKTADNILTVL